MSEPERLLASGSTLARRLLESGSVERPSSVSLERTIASLTTRGHTGAAGRKSDTRQRWVVQSSVQLRSRTRQWPWLALLAGSTLLVSAMLSYHWRPTPERTSGSAPAAAGWQRLVR